MYVVYWSIGKSGNRKACSREFDTSDMASALSWMEELRKKQRNREETEDVAFIALAVEHPDSIGPSGVSDPPADYSWKKRRR